MADSCTIEANPDIAGIGVRVSIYIQALFALLPAALALYKYGTTRRPATSNAGTTGAPEVATEDISLSDLWRQHREAVQHTPALSDEEKEEEQDEVRETWLPVQVTGAALLISAIIQVKLYGLDLYHALIVINLSWINNITAFGLAITDMVLENPADFFSRRNKAILPYVMCSLHLTATAAFGLWVFSNINNFGGNTECNSDIHYWVFGHQVSTTAPGFRTTGLVISGLAICPIINLALELCFEMVLSFAFLLPTVYFYAMVTFVRRLPSNSGMSMMVGRSGLGRLATDLLFRNSARRVYILATPYAFMVIIFIIATEELIVVNSALVQEGENDWTFGQTLAMFVILPVLLDVYSKLRKAWKIWKKITDGGEVDEEAEIERDDKGEAAQIADHSDEPAMAQHPDVTAEATERPTSEFIPEETTFLQRDDEITLPHLDA
ncbi:hypothetical protein CALCODRAFT_515942 [Calocera cornea HHB12733]|uniref:Uncharacterized protein n=1 Tax=Calocera cornea HHB12733 TaxID=1353952 RepID=A0A165HRZ0_9BASI|nr:hypothetical protein CALCODRAFT_515942 [Calocera cornea HHB12733]